VTVISSTTGNSVTLIGPVLFSEAYGTALSAVSGAPTTVVFDGRGLVVPATTSISRYRLSMSSWADTVCISGSGIVLMRGCAL
jgi:hypothetical protein